jgi:hypothetical protein
VTHSYKRPDENLEGTLHLDVSMISLTKEQSKKGMYATLVTKGQVKRNGYQVLDQAFRSFVMS